MFSYDVMDFNRSLLQKRQLCFQYKYMKGMINSWHDYSQDSQMLRSFFYEWLKKTVTQKSSFFFIKTWSCVVGDNDEKSTEAPF